jgi:hypothetical protein
MGKDEEDLVTSADQQKINTFSRLNSRQHEIEEDLDLQRVRRRARANRPPRRQFLRAARRSRARASRASRRKRWRSSTT